MRRLRKVRRWAIWACAGLAGVIALVWVASGWYVAGVYRTGASGTRAVQIKSGQLVCYSMNVAIREEKGVRVFRRQWETWRWRFESRRNNTLGVKAIVIAVPLWPAFLITAAGAAGLWGLDRWAAAANKGRCPSCGYDLRGLASGAACPECGTMPTGAVDQRRNDRT